MKLLIKPAIVLGAILGAVFGVVLLIPFLNCMACFSFSFIGAAIVYYLKKNDFVGILSPQDGALIGSISGFVSLFAASVIYLPVSYLIRLVFQGGINTGLGLANSFLIASFNIFATMMIVFFLAILSALFNAFTGLVVAYIYERIENNPLKDEQPFIIEQ